MAHLLRVPMAPDLGEPRGVALPIVRTRLRRGDRMGRKYLALVDSGAMFTVARMEVAADFGLAPETVKTSPEVASLAGANDGLGEAWGWEFELHLGDGGVSSRLVLPGARVYFTDWGLTGFRMVLGQHDLLEQLTFGQANHAPEPSFTLRFPPRR